MRADRQRQLQLQLWAQDHALAWRVEKPEDWPAQIRLGPSGLCPSYCGDHALGFVGLYAIINGIALLVSDTDPLKPAEEKLLLDIGWRFLMGRGPVAPWHGIRQHNFERLADALTYAISRHRKIWLRCDKIRLAQGQSQLSITLERLLVAKQAVIVLLGRGHYSVVRGYTPLSWLLFDATGRMWTRRGTKSVFANPHWGRARPFVLTLAKSI